MNYTRILAVAIFLFSAISSGIAAASGCKDLLENGDVTAVWWREARVILPSELSVGDVLLRKGLPQVIIDGPKTVGAHLFYVFRDMKSDGTLDDAYMTAFDEDYYLQVGNVRIGSLKNDIKAYAGILKAPYRGLYAQKDFVTAAEPLIKKGAIVQFTVLMHVDRIEALGGHNRRPNRQIGPRRTYLPVSGFARVVKAGDKKIQIEPLAYTGGVRLTAPRFDIDVRELRRRRSDRYRQRVEVLIDPTLSVGQTFNIDLINLQTNEYLGQLIEVQEDGLKMETSGHSPKTILFKNIFGISGLGDLAAIDKNGIYKLRIGTVIRAKLKNDSNEAANDNSYFHYLGLHDGVVRLQRAGDYSAVDAAVIEIPLTKVESVWVVTD